MTKEVEPKIPTTPSKHADDRPRPKQEKNTKSLASLFDAIRLKALMEKEQPGSTALSKLKDLEEKLDDGNQQVKAEASSQLSDLMRIKASAEVKAEKIETVSDLLNASGIDDGRKDRLKDVAKNIDDLFAKAGREPQNISDTELESAHAGLETIAQGLGMRENAVGLEEVGARLGWLEASKRAKDFISDREVYTSPVKEYEGEFDVTGATAPKVLKLTDVPADQRVGLQKKLDTFKQHVAEELIHIDENKIKEMTPNDLVNRLEETTYWQANIKNLHGRREWKGTKNLNELDDMLGRVEAQYQALLEDKMVQSITEKRAAENLEPSMIRESVSKSLRARRRFLRTEYDFNKGVDHGKSRADVLEEEVAANAKTIQKSVERRVSRVTNDGVRTRQIGEQFESTEREFTDEESKEMIETQKRMRQKLNSILNKLGIDEQAESKMPKSSKLREQILEKANNILSPDELKIYEKQHMWWEQHARGGMRGELSPIQDSLEALKATKQYNKFAIKLKAYVERVGLREASSDWDFAIMMREAKEEISRVNSDAGEKLDQWQEALFAPSITTLDEKSFFDVMPKIMSQSRLEHELSPKYANWEAMQVTGSDGTKKVISVASFYQLLQREDVAKTILNADTNGNDSAIQKVLVEHIWGPGARLETIPREGVGKSAEMKVWLPGATEPITNIDINYFNSDTKVFDSSQGENLKLEEFIDQSMWMTHYAKTLWHYSGEWETFLRDFPGDQLSQANKRLLAVGAAYRDYGLDYGKFDVGYAQLAKAGVLLQDFRTYKAMDVLKANIRHLMVEQDENGHQISDWKRGDALAEGLWQMVQKKANISEHYKPVVGMRTVEEIRLMGNLPKSEEESWNWFKKNQEKLGRKNVMSYAQVKALTEQDFKGLTGEQEAWVVQFGEVNKWVADLRLQRAKIGGEMPLVGMKTPPTTEELRALLNKQSLLTTGEPYSGEVSLDAYLRNFEYSSIIDHAQLKKGTDPLDYKKYSDAKCEAAGLMNEVLSGAPSLDTLTKLFNTMKGYMPPDQILGWFEEYTKTKIRLRTFQGVRYDIAMTDLEWWEAREKKGEHDIGSKPIGFNPAAYKIKDNDGDLWNVVGSDGFKVTKMKKEWGNHMLKTRNLPGYTAKDIEIQMKLFVGNRWLPNKEVAEEIVEEAMGLGQTMDRLFGEKAKKTAVFKFVRKWGTKGILLLRKHPIFDDPVWAFWALLEEYREFGAELGKELEKDVVGGHH